MSKKIYICSTMNGSGAVTCSGDSEVTSTYIGEEAQDFERVSLNEAPALVKVHKTKRTYWEGTTLDASTVRSARILNWELQIANRNTTDIYQKDYYLAYFSTYCNQINLLFPVTVRYMSNNVSTSQVIDIMFPGTALSNLYGSTSTRVITEQFNNLGVTYNPLYDISIDTSKGPTITSNTDTPLTTTLAVSILKTTTNFRAELLKATLTQADTSSTIYYLTVPDSSRIGRLYIKHFFLNDLAQQCYYTYQGVRNPNKSPTYYGEPPSVLYNRSASIETSVYELYAGRDNYNNAIVDYRGKDIRNMFSSSADTVSSSFDDDVLKAIKGYKSDGSVAPTLTSLGVSWSSLELICWLDCVLFKFSFSTSYYSLGDLLIYGAPIPTGVSTIGVEIILPNLSTFVGGSISTPQDLDFIGGFNPYNTFDLNIDFGYHSNNPKSYLDSREGLYYNTNKVKRLFVGKLEISHFVVDEDTTDSTSPQIVSLKDATVTFKTYIDFSNIKTDIKYNVNFIKTYNSVAYSGISVPRANRIFYIGESYNTPVYNTDLSPTPWGTVPENKTIKLTGGDDVNNPAFIRFIQEAAESIVGATYE